MSIVEEPPTQFEKIVTFIRTNRWLVLGIVLALVVLLVWNNHSSTSAAEKNQQEVLKLAEQEATSAPDNSGISNADPGTDEMLFNQQPDLTQRFGEAPENFLWDLDGSLLSLGDKSMTPEDVLYTYLRGATTLDFNVVQMFTKRSSVYNTYSGYFDKSTTTTDSVDKFNRDMYRQMLTSMQVEGIQDTSRFSDNRRVFTVSAKILDLTDQSFWKADREQLMNTLYDFGATEGDQGKADDYLFGYILDYYQSPKATMKSVTFDITLTTVPAWNSGWLISIDSDLNNLLQNKGGSTVVQQIKTEYQAYRADRVSH